MLIMNRPAPSFSFYHSKTEEEGEKLQRDTVVLASSYDLGWNGAAAEVGRSRAWEPVELASAGHYLAINLDSKPLPMETRDGRKRRRVALPPGSFQITPAGVPFTMRILKPSRFGAVEISLARIRELLGYDLQLEPGLGIVDEALAEVMLSLLAEVVRGGSSGPLYAEGLLIAIVSRLAYAHGPGPPAQGRDQSLSTKRLSQVTEAVESRLTEPLTVEELAKVAQLSPAQFTHDLLRATRETPQAFVLRRRLERARQLLLDGSSIAAVAHRCGFLNEAHLSGPFKERFGVTPSVLVRGSRR
jgi:AraC family transcriptional regulator